MPFVLAKRFSSGKLIRRFPLISALDTRSCSAPALDHSPPQQPHPFVHARLGPLPANPPTLPELRVVPGRRRRERLPTNLVTEDAQRPARVEVRCDNQDPAARFACQAFFRIARFIAGREPNSRTDANRCCLRKPLHILLRQLDLTGIVDPGRGGNVDHHLPSIALIQQLQGMLRTAIRLARQNQNHVRRLRSIHHQQLACVRREHHQRGSQYYGNDPDTSSFPYIFRQSVPRQSIPPRRSESPLVRSVTTSVHAPRQPLRFSMLKLTCFMLPIYDSSWKNS